MNAGRERGRFWLLLALLALTTFGAALAATLQLAPSIVVLAIAVSFVPYAGALWFARAIDDPLELRRIALGAVLLFGSALLVAPPALSDDLYRYLWEGRLWLEGLNPYHLPPDDPALHAFRDDLWTRINNKPLASIYPPLAQLLFALAALGASVTAVKVVAFLGHLAATVVVARISPDPRAPLVLGLNPLLLAEGALNGHFDIMVGAALLVSAWALGQKRVVRASAAAIAAVGLKVVGVVLLPLFWRRPRALLTLTVACACLLAPLALGRSFWDAASGPGQFAARWEGNDSAFALVRWIAERVLDEDGARLAARVFVLGVTAAVAVIVMRRRTPPLEAARALIWTVLLLSPQVHPWYLAWMLPLELACGGRAGWVWSAAALCAYAPLDRWVEEGVWQMPLSLQTLEYAVLGAALAIDRRRPGLPKGSTVGYLLNENNHL